MIKWRPTIWSLFGVVLIVGSLFQERSSIEWLAEWGIGTVLLAASAVMSHIDDHMAKLREELIDDGGEE